MPRLLLLLLVALGGAAIWRRREIRNDADRASKAIAGAAGAAKSKIRPIGESEETTDDGESDDGADATGETADADATTG